MVALAGQNLDSGLDPLSVLPTLVVVALICVGLTVGSAYLSGAPLNAALVVTTLAVFVMAYGHVSAMVSPDQEWWLLVPWLLAALTATSLAARVRASMAERIGRAAAVMSGLVLVFNMVPFAVRAADAGASEAGSLGPDRIRTEGPTDARDVIYIVLDRYPGAETLETVYDYDNTDFLSRLEERAFYVAEDSFANYPKTVFSLAATLSMDYLEMEPLSERAGSPADVSPLERVLAGHLAAPKFLTERGYEYINISSWFEETGRGADVSTSLSATAPSEFSSQFYETSVFGAVQRLLDIETPLAFRDVARSRTLFQLEALEEMTTWPSPKFVLAHVLLPHEPYVFDSQGGEISARQEAVIPQRDLFIGQLEYVNTRVLAVIDEFQKLPANERPVIVVQADEGPYPSRFVEQRMTFDWRRASQEEYRQKYLILNAIYLPGVSTRDLYPSISSVNTFRLILRAYFGARLELLPDRAYVFGDEAHVYDLIDISQWVGPEALTRAPIRATYDVPRAPDWQAGETLRHTVSITNEGTTPWHATGGDAVELGVHFGGDSDLPGDAWATDQRFPIPDDVPPGSTVEVRVEVAAPEVAGAYVLRHRLVGQASWSSSVDRQKVNVVSSPSTWKAWLSAAYAPVVPADWTAGEAATYTVELTNDGAYPWTSGGERFVRLAISFGGDSDFPGDGWVAETRVMLPRDVAPGESVSMQVEVEAPREPGNYVLRHWLVKENVAWFDEVDRRHVVISAPQAGMGWEALTVAALGLVLGTALLMALRKVARPGG